MNPLRRLTADVAVDLGTATTRVVVRTRSTIFSEPSAVAIRGGSRGREVVAVGSGAREMLGRTPAGLQVLRPIRGGVIADFESAEQLLQVLLAKAGGTTVLRPRVLVCVPSQTSEVERRAVQESTRAAGARDVILVPIPLAAALGAGLPVNEPVGSMVVDIGAGKTEVAVTSLGGTVVSRAVRVAGDALDDAIGLWLRSNHNIIVGGQTAEALKVRVGAATSEARNEVTSVRGRDATSGSPRESEVTTAELAEAMAEPLGRIIDTVLATLRVTPPELCADILDHGIVMTGGTALLPGIADLLRDATGLPVVVSERALQATAAGAARLLKDADLFERFTVTG